MKKIIVLNKREGETPLQVLEKFRRKYKEYRGEKMTYAGRLDPMAKGLLLVLAGEETKNKEKYLALDKEYEFEVLFGFATDTYDILGKVVKNTEVRPMYKKLTENINESLKYFTGKFVQKYPIYSSKTVKGKQLFHYARRGVEVEIPEQEVFVKKLKFLKFRKISEKRLLANIERRIKKVQGDFRQEEILKIWQNKFSPERSQEFLIGSFKIECGSGTYVRGIANSLGEQIGIPILAFSIKRTRIGKWSRI